MESTRKRKINLKRLFILLFGIVLFASLLVGLYFGLGLNQSFENEESLKAYLSQYGTGFGVKLIYIMLHFIQTTILPISNLPTIIAGTYLFGRFETAILTNIGVLIGSVTSFTFGRLFGKKAVYWIVDKDVVDHYLDLIKKKEKVAIFAMLLLPGFPDDIICILAGMTYVSWPYFLITISITRTIPNFMYVYFFNLIPLESIWGLLIWVGIFLLFLLISSLTVRNWGRISAVIDRITAKRDRHKLNHNSDKNNTSQKL